MKTEDVLPHMRRNTLRPTTSAHAAGGTTYPLLASLAGLGTHMPITSLNELKRLSSSIFAECSALYRLHLSAQCKKEAGANCAHTRPFASMRQSQKYRIHSFFTIEQLVMLFNDVHRSMERVSDNEMIFSFLCADIV